MRYLLLAILVLISACSSSSDDSDSDLGVVRAVNLIDDSDVVGFQIDEEDFAFVQYRTATVYSPVDGSVEVDLELVGADNLSTTLVNDRALTVEDDMEYTLFAVGSTSDGDFITVVTDSEEITSDFAKIQFVNATQAGYSVNLHVPDSPDNTIFTQALSGREFSNAEEVSTRQVQLTVTEGDGTVVFSSVTFTLQNEADIVFALTDYLGPGDAGVDVFEVNDNGSVVALGRDDLPASIRYVNAMPGLSDLTVTTTDLLQTNVTALDLSYAQATDRVVLDASAYDITTTPIDNIGAPIFNTTLSLIGGIEYTFVLTGDLAAPDSFLLVDDTRVIATHARLEIAHAAESLEESDVYIAAFGSDIFIGTKISEMPYRTSRDFLFEDGLYNITVTTADTESIIIGPITIDLMAGSTNTVLIREDVDGDAPYGLTTL